MPTVLSCEPEDERGHSPIYPGEDNLKGTGNVELIADEYIYSSENISDHSESCRDPNDDINKSQWDDPGESNFVFEVGTNVKETIRDGDVQYSELDKDKKHIPHSNKRGSNSMVDSEDYKGPPNFFGALKRTPKKSKFVQSAMGVSECALAENGKGRVRARKTTNTASNKAKLVESIPFWISQPKDVKDIPVYAKTVCARLLHIEKQMKALCAERQGLLCSIWRLNQEGYGNCLPESIFQKSLDVCNQSEPSTEVMTPKINSRLKHRRNDPQEFAISENSPEIVNDHQKDYRCENGAPKVFQLDQHSNGISDEKLSSYNSKDYNSERNESGRIEFWKSCWLRCGRRSYCDVAAQTDANISLKCDENQEFVECIELSDSSKEEESEVPREPDSCGDHGLSGTEKDPLDYFKNVDFVSLSQEIIDLWSRFFGIKTNDLKQQIEVLERIRGHLMSYK